MKYLIPPYLILRPFDGVVIPAQIIETLSDETKDAMKQDVVQDYIQRRMEIQQRLYDNLRDEDRYYHQRLMEIETR